MGASRPDQRRPVIFLPSAGLPAGAWDRWVELFSAHGYAATAPDQSVVRPGRAPVLVGCGPGGLLALSLAGPAGAAGVIVIDAAGAAPDDPADGGPVLVVLSGQGLSVITGPGWREIAGSCLSWLDAHEL
jgi:hypothetical protein